MTHRLASGNRIYITQTLALFLGRDGLKAEITPRRAVAMILSDLRLRKGTDLWTG